MLKQSTNQPFVREAAPKRVFKREGKLEINPLLLLAFGITPEEIGAVIKSAEEPEAMRDMFAFLSDYAALSDPRTRSAITDEKLDFLVADLKRRMAHVAEFYREQAIEYGKLVRFMDHVKVRKLQTADRLQRITEEARKLSAFSGQTRTDKVAFIDAVAHLEHTTGSVIPIAFGISDYGREDYWPRKLLAFLRTHGMPGMVRENVHADVPAPVPKKIPLQMTTGLPGLPPFGKIPPVIRPEKEAWQIPFEKFEHYVIYGHIAFTDSFRKFISEGYKISIQNRHHLLKPSKFGTVRQALSPEFVAIFPPQVLDNTEIYLATDIDNKYLSGALVSKISEGHYHIVMNPEQAGVDYVPLLFHEIKHVYDMVRGKSVAVTGIVGPEEFVEYKRLPSERRARRAEFAIIRAAHKNAVMKAIQEGKPVPPEVLAEYLGIAGAPAAVREAPAPAPDRGEPKINWNLNIREGRIVYMPPEEYMERINIFNRIGMSRVIEEEQRAIGRGYRGIGYYPPLSEQSYRSILEGIRAGNQIDIPNIVYRNGKVENHEGFHRALVARDIGIDKIPVQVIGEIPSSFSRALNLRWNENLTEQAKAINALKGKIMGGGSIIRESVAPEPANKEFKANPGLINKQAAYAAHIGTSFEPEKRGEQAIRGFAEEVQAVYERLKPHARTDAEKALLIAEMERFQAAYAQKYNDLLYAHSRIVSTMIAGPSKFPTERMRKINEAYDNKARETYEWKDRAEKAMLRALKGIAIEEAGGEVAVLKAKIAQAEKLQEMMVEGNKIVRKKAEPGIGGVSKQQQLINLGFTERQAAEALKPDFAGRLGFPSFALTNNSANIRRMKERLIELEKKEVTPTAEIPFTGGHIVDNRELDRVQIIFDQKPGQEVINKLKSEGWRWSPSNMAWQRKRTDYAMMSARRITGAAQPPAPAVPPVTPASPVVSPVVPPVQAPEERCIEYRLPLSKLKELALTIQSKYRLPNIYLGGSHSPKSSHYPKKDSDIDFTSYLWEYTEYVNYVHATPELSRLYEECRTAHACIARVAINGVKIHLRVEPIHTTFMPLEDQMILAGQMPIAPMLYPAPQPQAELRWVYGTQDMAWHLVGPEDRDYAHGITQERMRQIGQDAARAEYLSPSLARTAIPVPQVPTRMRVYVPPKPPLMLYPLLEAPRLPLPAPVSPEVRQYTTPRIFRKGTIARNKKTNEKFVLETEVEAYQQNKDATIWKTDEGHWIYLHEQLPAPTPPKHIIITPEDERLLKGYENY
ncbi:MAG: hypothetical protein Q8P40_13910, partial [Nitrospirota bacterium]|nr:hypothetical protein [Nitrospirota bacterium]